MVTGEIALMNNAAQAEADCDNYEKAMLAESLGAGAVIFSGTMAPSRVFQATWREGDAMLTIPAIGVTQSTGDILRQGGGQIARVFTDTQIEVLHTYNVFATSLAGDADSTVMAGAHLDSVPEGPGINDNGSGSATMLAIARSFEARSFVPNNRLRFAWWGAEEVGLIGSRYYVRDLVENDPGEFDRIALYLNFDMVSTTGIL
jgi:Zn-dependent M28 family amino/carboxypeptidase